MAIKFGRPIEMRNVSKDTTSAAALDLTIRPRRNRKAEWARRLVSEHVLTASDLIWPLFLIEGRRTRVPVAAMPGVDRLPVSTRLPSWTSTAGKPVRNAFLIQTSATSGPRSGISRAWGTRRAG